MSLLNLHARPWVSFDVTNVEHRQWVAEFTRTKTWKTCPVRFAVDEDGDTLAVIQRRLIKYYSELEFGAQ